MSEHEANWWRRVIRRRAKEEAMFTHPLPPGQPYRTRHWGEDEA